MKKIILMIIFVISAFLCILDAKATISSNTQGEYTSLNLDIGSWYSSLVGLKIHVVSGTRDNWGQNNVEQSAIFLNGTSSTTQGAKFNTYACPKSFYENSTCSNTAKWVSYSNITKYIDSDNLPKSWLDSNDNAINLDSFLEANNYAKIKKILATDTEINGVKVFPTLTNDDYIVVEPMVYVDGYYGTAFELLNDRAGDLNECSNYFCGWHSGAVFGGTSRMSPGLLWNTLFEQKPIKNLNLYDFAEWKKRTNPKGSTWTFTNKCLAAKTCSRGIGVYLYNELFPDNPGDSPGDNPGDGPGDGPDNSCENELSKIEKTPKLLFDLYRKLEQNEGIKYKGLLNFDNPSCEQNTKEAKNVKCMNITIGKIDLDFSDANVETIADGTSILCKKNFSLEGNGNGGFAKPGTLLYKKNKIDFISFASLEKDNALNIEAAVDATATLTLTCYSPETIAKQNITYFNDEISGNVYMDGQELNKTEPYDLEHPEKVLKDLNGNISGYLYEKNIIVNYNFPKVYSMSGSRKIVYEKDYEKLCKNKEITVDGKTYDDVCKYIGRGIVTKFNDATLDSIEFLYKNGTDEYSASCEVQFKNNGLDLEFRTIDASYTEYDDKKVFPGKKGEGRNLATNWCTPLRKKVLVERNNSTNKENDAPVYKIKLTQSDIKEIREYNKNNSYDTQIYCDDQGNCKSEFMELFKIKRNEETLWEKNYKSSFQYGDVDLDGTISSMDATAIQVYISGQSGCNYFDENYIDLADVDGDGIVSKKDYSIIQSNNAQLGTIVSRLGQRFYK